MSDEETDTERRTLTAKEAYKHSMEALERRNREWEEYAKAEAKAMSAAEQAVFDDMVALLLEYTDLRAMEILPDGPGGHGTCCMCAHCHHDYDDCVCLNNELVRKLKEIAREHCLELPDMDTVRKCGREYGFGDDTGGRD